MMLRKVWQSTSSRESPIAAAIQHNVHETLCAGMGLNLKDPDAALHASWYRNWYRSMCVHIAVYEEREHGVQQQ
jgi:hypothetical protein